MPTVPVVLYRSGNATSPRLTHVRSGKDVITQVGSNGVVNVLPLTGGVSLFSVKKSSFAAHWWKIDQGEWYDFRLILRRGANDHWTCEPANMMPLDDYLLALGATEKTFTKA